MGIARCLPSLLVGAYFFIVSSDPLGVTLLTALGGAIWIPFIAVIAVMFCQHGFAKISKSSEVVADPDFESPSFMGGVLACALVWVWLSFTHELWLRKLPECITLEIEAGNAVSVRDAISNCRRSEPDDESDDF